MPIKTRRLRSDALYRVCKKFGAHVLKELHPKNSIGSDHSLKFQLINYYIQWKGEWSREKEVRDWKDHDLAPLKHKTYRMVLSLFLEGKTNSTESFYQLLSDVSAAFGGKAYDFVLDLCKVSIPLAKEREYYTELLALLQLERRALEELGEAEEEDRGRILENRINTDQCLTFISEIREVEMFRLQYYEPLKRKKALKGGYEASDLKVLTTAISQISLEALQTARAKYAFLSVHIPYLALIGNEALAYESGKQLVGLYKTLDWLREERDQEFLYHSGGVAAFAARCGDRDAAMSIINELEVNLAGLDEKLHVTGLQVLARANLIVGLSLGESKLIREGLEIAEKNHSTIKEGIDTKRLAFLYFLSAQGGMLIGNWAEAWKYLDMLLGIKTKLARQAFINVRVMWLMCLLYLPGGMERILSEDDAAEKFLRRQSGDQSFLLRVIHHLGKIANAYPVNVQSRCIATERALAEVIELKKTVSGQEAFKIYDYQCFFERYLSHLRSHL